MDSLSSSAVSPASPLAPLPPRHLETITRELAIQPRQVMATALLLKEGATVPFIARYRKEVTGSLDEVAITAIRDRMEKLAELDSRREAILKSLDERKLLTAELKKAVEGAATRWRTSICRSARRSAPGPRLPKSRGSNRWPTCSSPRPPISTRAPRPNRFWKRRHPPSRRWRRWTPC